MVGRGWGWGLISTSPEYDAENDQFPPDDVAKQHPVGFLGEIDGLDGQPDGGRGYD